MKTNCGIRKPIPEVKRGDVRVMPAGSHVYYVRTPEELEALYADDRRRGDTIDDAGERRIHHRQGTIRLEEPTSVMILALKGAPWHAWHRKPRGLVRAVITSGPNVGIEVSLTKQAFAAHPPVVESNFHLDPVQSHPFLR
jgi:hypothetical protein